MKNNVFFNALNVTQAKCQNPESVFFSLVASTSFVAPEYQSIFVYTMTQVFVGQSCTSDQLNIICEFNPFYINELKAETGLHIGQLRELAQTGGLTTATITKALLRQKHAATPLQSFEFDRVINPPMAQIEWANAPAWANYWCTTISGQAWWLESEWVLNPDRGCWSVYAEYNEYGDSEAAPSFGYSGDWKESMTKRPEKAD